MPKKNEGQTVASVCMDYVLKGYTVEFREDELLQLIEDPNGNLVSEIHGDPDSIMVGEALGKSASRRIYPQIQNQPIP